MSNPWDRPPFPANGDENQDHTYAGVGYVLTHWEMIEAELSHIYAICIGQLFKKEAYDQYYDEAKTSKNRLKSVQDKAERYFQKSPNQEHEAQFCELMRKIEGFSNRRHEAAHGVVRPIQWYRRLLPDAAAPSDTHFQFCLVPPHYQRDWFDENEMPRYVYTSVELIAVTNALAALLQEVLKMRHTFQGKLRA